MSDETYNGWPNYATWAVYTWLTNDEQYEQAARAAARAAEANEALYLLARGLMEGPLLKIDTMDTGRGLAHDLATWALLKVDWPRIQAALTE